MATISSFQSVALSPPTISFALRHPSRLSQALVKDSQRYVLVQLLASDQGAWAEQYAHPDTQMRLPKQIQPKRWHHEVPLLPDCVAWLHCHALESHRIADHEIWYARVDQVELGDPDASPLLYRARKYTQVASSTQAPP
jgi:flavin reductase (DIM6/NTAB) family NADH-FMN oxidoreductase RutF